MAATLGFYQSALLGHDIRVHQAITANAVTSAFNDSTAFSQFIDTISSDRILSQATKSMVDGSGFEDNINIKGDAGGIRSYNHFYDPLDTTYGKGLSDWPADTRILIGTNSFNWASISNGMGYNFYGGNFLFFSNIAPNLNTTNIWSWPNARGYEWLGLTATNQLERQTNLDNMFRAVGQVMHLLEDASQPQHVRNEQHVDKFPQWRSPIEDYGNLNVLKLNYGDGSMLDWRGGGFTKLEDFWDRHLYDGSSAALDDVEADGGTQLGLAEWCNGNFLGDRHQYADYYTNGDIRYYPYPSRISGTITPHIDSIIIKNGRVLSHYYLKKDADGISITHHSALTLWGMEHPNIWKAKSTTIRDDNVLYDYHNAFIPKAVKYSAGLLDYFFRGTFIVTLSSNTNLTVLNTSGQDFSGGSFLVFEDDTNRVRILVLQTNLSATLATNQTMEIIVSNPAPPNTDFFVIYQGTIGVIEGTTNALDPVDAGIGIAVAVSSNTVWQSSFEGNGETNYNAEAGDYFAEGWHVDSADVNVVVSSAAYKGTHFLNLNGDSGQPGIISTNIDTVPGFTYQLNFAYSENPDGRDFAGQPTGVVEVLENDNQLLTLTVNKPDNTWTDLEWSQASVTFTADSSVTQIQFASQTANIYGVLLDAVSLDVLSTGP
ncbi:MAG: DUF642 domain-containing protein [Verrucomicrobiia bacterium]